MAKISIDTDTLQEIDDNLLGTIVDGKLVLVIDTTIPDNQLELSSTGKTRFLASTSGWKGLPGKLTGSIMVGKKVR
jgi:hypothetical protein